MSEWKAAPTSTTWRPTDVGETLTGRYRGSRQRRSGNGPYLQYTIEHESGEKFYITGSSIDEGLENVPVGALVRVVYGGTITVDGSSGYFYRKFTVHYKPDEGVEL